MATETIDELVTKLTLDPSQFTAGQRQAEASIQSLKSSVATSAEDMGASIAGVLGKFSALTIGIAGLAGAVDLVKNMAFHFKDLAIQAEALGSSTRTLRTLEEFSQFAGAPAGAAAQFGQQGLSSVYSLIYGPLAGLGQIGGLASLGFQNPWGAVAEETQNPKSFYRQLIQNVRDQLPQIMAVNPFGLKPEANVAQTLMARLPGLTEPFAAFVASNAVSKNPLIDFDKAFATAAKRNESVSERTAHAATEAANAMIDLKTAVENEATRGFGVLDVGINLANDALSLFDSALNVVSTTLNEMENSPFFKWLQKQVEAPASPLRVVATTATHDALRAGGIILGVNRDLLSGHPVTAVENAGRATGGLLSDIFSQIHGPQAVDALGNLIAAGFPVVSDGYSTDTYGIPSIAPLKLQPFVPHALPIPPSLGALHSMAGGSSHSNSVTIGNMTVNTQATDANGIAAGMHAAVARKFNVSQADSGVTQ